MKLLAVFAGKRNGDGDNEKHVTGGMLPVDGGNSVGFKARY